MVAAIKVRETYTNDAIKLRRLRDSIVKDTRKSQEWKAEAIQHLDALIKQFVTA